MVFGSPYFCCPAAGIYTKGHFAVGGVDLWITTAELPLVHKDRNNAQFVGLPKPDKVFLAKNSGVQSDGYAKYEVTYGGQGLGVAGGNR